MCLLDFNCIGFLSPEIDEWTEEQNFESNNLYKFSLNLNRYCQKILYKLDIHNEDQQELLVSTLFIRSLSVYQGVMLLLRKGMIIEAKILSRSLLEIVFRIRAICKSSQIAIDFINQDKLNQLKMINKLNNLSKNIKSKIDLSVLEERKIVLEKEVKNLEVTPHKNKTCWYASKAGLMDDYHTTYSFLCDPVHSNVNGLQSYLIIKDDKVISFKYGPSTKEFEIILNAITESMIYILEDLNILFKLNITNEISPFSSQSNWMSEKLIENDPT